MYTYVIVPASVDPAAGRSARREPGLKWCRFGDRVIYWTTGIAQSSAGRRVRTLGPVSQSSQGLLHLVVQAGNSFREEFPEVPVILDRGRYLAVELSDEEFMRASVGNPAHFGVRPLPQNSSIVRETGGAGRRLRAVDPTLTMFANEVSATHVKDSLVALTGFGTRHSLSQGFVQAGAWVTEVLQSLGYAVTRATISVGAGASFSVIGDKPGLRDNPELVLVTAHLDSTNHVDGPLAPAPGADDNGSGCAGVLEIARILAGRADDQDLRLVLFGGEEQGLFGSEQYVRALSEHDRGRLQAVINMDMVGTLNSALPGVLLEGGPLSQGLIDELTASAQDYTTLAVEVSLTPFASDHVPFLNAGLPAVLTIEGSDSTNNNIHSSRDTLDRVNYPLACEIIKMNLVTTARLIGTRASIADLERWRQSTTNVD
ncbi:M28 family metallopeptidase [Cryobacterium psychrophilum]|uniref:Zn-dependent exopeptidase M28 n=1 Tax=Cryobacterium psychrophilum TaxID=41988 RepID=A0A4Y8KIP7_9MICO|nr:M28 family metallopeptidase [Cryobacterium psychrophilum]TDW29989.1 Zn-dependent M28 family amino/carboxypeptidase [Cryobacterium psychrophilum]TFD75561.1 Zn-dependent exopeptidase M28 [Cryobacterium psychrophilum]